VQSPNPTWNWIPGSNEEDMPFFDPNDPTGLSAYYYDASQSDFHKSSDGGNSFCTIPCNGLYASWLRSSIPFSFAMAFHPSQANRFMAMSGLCPTGGLGASCNSAADCCQGLYCDNNHTCQGTPSQCTVLETSDGWLTTRDLRPPIATVGCPTAVSYSGAYRYVAAAGNLYQGRDDGQGGITWTNVWSGPNYIRSILGDPQNPNSVYFATFEYSGVPGHVFFKSDQTDNLGWTLGAGVREITSDLPVKVVKLALIPSYGRPPTLYALGVDGNVTGWGPTSNVIYSASRLNGSTTHWAPFANGLPDISVTDINVNPWYHGVYAATYGRGAWSVTDYSIATEAIENLGFETGNLAGWTAQGSASIVTSSHSGSFAVQLGSTAPTNLSSISQILELPATATHLSFWYRITCPDTVTYDWAKATLTNNLTGVVTTLLAPTCTNTGQWVFVTADVSASANSSVTLTLTNKDDNYPGDATYTWFDDLSVY
jgi:hypothetical protein